MARANLNKNPDLPETNEVINTASHLAAACFALLGSVLLIAEAASRGKVWAIVAFAIYGLSLTGLFAVSALYHGLNAGEQWNRRLRTFDFLAIFTLIAGTVTPVALVLYRNIFGWSILSVVWAIAIFGISLRATNHNLPSHITSTLFIVLGWLPAILILIGGPLPPAWALALLVLGGLFYTGGLAIYASQKPNPKPGFFGFHEIWHIIVVAGAFCHYLFMYLYVLNQ